MASLSVFTPCLQLTFRSRLGHVCVVSSSKIVRSMMSSSTGSPEERRVPFAKKHEGLLNPELIRQLEDEQAELTSKIVEVDTQPWQSDFSELRLIAGLDISYSKPKDTDGDNDNDIDDVNNSAACAAVVICTFPELKIVHSAVEQVHLDRPYVAGFLAFREFPSLLKVLSDTINNHPEFTPQVVFVDGNGTLHPQRSGLACHIGYHTSIPTIGVAKNMYYFPGLDQTKPTVVQNLEHTDFIPLKNKDNEVIGLALKTVEPIKNPIYVSVGHNISLETARKLVLACCKYRIPEPIRFADNLSREYIRKLEHDSKKSNIISS